ncbi:MAG: alpha/beta hydrolase [Gammaproteobacteria bacterium]|nr:alpha/beta hydrolase [Gammaproteobacteria bacterium]MDH3429946.1 alpha/beta hydrolase [Gammaproteobacteria bacterium]MDH3432425.1 alpha/beta hydrolase [Gammaproteobacteria bacterium]
MSSAIVLVASGLLVAGLVAYFVFPAHLVKLLVRAARLVTGFRSRSVDVDGDTWPYLEGGPESAEIVVLLHGFGGDKDNWPLYARYLRGKYRVIIPDLPGFGENSRKSGADYRMAPQAARLHKFVRAMGIDRFHIAGNSMGGFLALQYALAYPSDVITIGLLNSAGVSSTNKSEVELAAARGENLLVVSSLDEFDKLMNFIAHKSIPLPGIIKREIGKRAIAEKEFLDPIFWALFESIIDRPLDERLHEIAAPTLIIWGRHDRVIDVSCTELMTARIPDNHCVVFADAGHIPMLECPAEAASAHLDYLNRHCVA